MTTQLAGFELFNGRSQHARTTAGGAVAGSHFRGHDGPLRVPRGIMFAVLLAAPFWAAVGLGYYYLW